MIQVISSMYMYIHGLVTLKSCNYSGIVLNILFEAVNNVQMGRNILLPYFLG